MQYSVRECNLPMTTFGPSLPRTNKNVLASRKAHSCRYIRKGDLTIPPNKIPRKKRVNPFRRIIAVQSNIDGTGPMTYASLTKYLKFGQSKGMGRKGENEGHIAKLCFKTPSCMFLRWRSSTLSIMVPCLSLLSVFETKGLLLRLMVLENGFLRVY